jgi:hypothetical protein
MNKIAKTIFIKSKEKGVTIRNLKITLHEQDCNAVQFYCDFCIYNMACYGDLNKQLWACYDCRDNLKKSK